MLRNIFFACDGCMCKTGYFFFFTSLLGLCFDCMFVVHGVRFLQQSPTQYELYENERKIMTIYF